VINPFGPRRWFPRLALPCRWQMSCRRNRLLRLRGRVVPVACSSTTCVTSRPVDMHRSKVRPSIRATWRSTSRPGPTGSSASTFVLVMKRSGSAFGITSRLAQPRNGSARGSHFVIADRVGALEHNSVAGTRAPVQSSIQPRRRCSFCYRPVQPCRDCGHVPNYCSRADCMTARRGLV